MINLDQQSQDFQLFVSNPTNRAHWIPIMINHLNKVNIYFPYQAGSSISI